MPALLRCRVGRGARWGFRSIIFASRILPFGSRPPERRPKPPEMRYATAAASECWAPMQMRIDEQGVDERNPVNPVNPVNPASPVIEAFNTSTSVPGQ